MAAKLQDKGPSQKEINQRLLDEEEEQSSKKPKTKNGWGKQK